MTIMHHLYRLSVRMQMLLSTLFLVFSAFILFVCATDVKQMRDVGLPAALQLPSLTAHMQILKAQSDAAQLQASLMGDSSNELLHVYTLPDSPSLDRMLSTFTLLFNTMEKTGQMQAVSSVTVGDTVMSAAQTLKRTPINFEADVTDDGLTTLLQFIQVSGKLTVSDTLSQSDIDQLLSLTESENPDAVTALETFLATDLLSYATNPMVYEDELMRSFSSADFAESFHAVLADSTLPSATKILSGPIGKALLAQKLWPLRFLTLTKTTVTYKGSNHYHVALSMDAYSRGN